MANAIIPQHRNPLIGSDHAETAENVGFVLAYLQISEAAIAGVAQSNDDIVSGRARILDVVQDAVASLGEAHHV